MDQISSYLVWRILLFPNLFQGAAFRWAWGAYDDFWIMLAKRFFFLLPVAAVVFGCWISIGCLLTLIVREKRREYASTLFITWWDLFRCIFMFWGGIFVFSYKVAGWLIALIRLLLFAIWLFFQDVVLSPLRAAKGVGEIASTPGTPWIAVSMTLAWCFLEAIVFTFIMTNFVREVVINITNTEINESVMQVVLFMMLLAFVVGSFAIVASLQLAIRSKDLKQIILVFIVELTALLFEVLFLYREFVDALIPWFAQYAGEGFTISPFVVILIASLAWAGIRGMTWFLFAQAGTPTIMAIIQRSGLSSKGGGSSLFNFNKKEQFKFVQDAIQSIKKDVDWVTKTGDDMVSSFVLPPLQVIAACLNFLTLLVSSKHLFSLPFSNFKEVLRAQELLRQIRD